MNTEYRKKPVVIEAVQISKRMDLTAPDWWAEAVQLNAVILHGMGKMTRDQPWVEIPTLEGVMRGDAGDWIIRGVQGELYPCKPDIFTVTYESAAEPAAAIAEIEPVISDELNPDTAKLVRRFARAVANKLLSAQRKYGYGNGWLADDWQERCREELLRHIAKGDPRDVAAYCAFMWHHDWSITAAPPAPIASASEAYDLQFPVSLRKMWAGWEVQKWLDDLPPLFTHPAAAQPSRVEAPGEVDVFLDEVRAELRRARAKFPGDRIMTIALAEEFGELCKAVLDESRANVRKEAVQTAVMAARVVLDGDGSVNEWRAERGLDQLIEASK